MQDNTHITKHYTITELAAMLNVHANTIARLIKEEKITAVKVAGVWRVPQTAVDAYLEPRTVKAKP